MRHGDLVILGILSGEPRHGYDVVKEIESMHVRAWARVGASTVYRSVQRLEERGYLKGSVDREGRRPERRVYSLTRAGRTRLADLVRRALGSSDPAYSDRVVGAVFARAALGEGAAPVMATTRKRLGEARARMETAEDHAGPVGRAVLRFNRTVAQAEADLLKALAALPGGDEAGAGRRRVPETPGTRPEDQPRPETPEA